MKFNLNYFFFTSLPSVCRTPSGLEDVSKYPALFAGLLASGTWTLDDLKKLAGLNFLRVLREVERVRIRRSLINGMVLAVRSWCSLTSLPGSCLTVVLQNHYMHLCVWLTVST